MFFQNKRKEARFSNGQDSKRGWKLNLICFPVNKIFTKLAKEGYENNIKKLIRFSDLPTNIIFYKRLPRSRLDLMPVTRAGKNGRGYGNFYLEMTGALFFFKSIDLGTKFFWEICIVKHKIKINKRWHKYRKELLNNIPSALLNCSKFLNNIMETNAYQNHNNTIIINSQHSLRQFQSKQIKMQQHL